MHLPSIFRQFIGGTVSYRDFSQTFVALTQQQQHQRASFPEAWGRTLIGLFQKHWFSKKMPSMINLFGSKNQISKWQIASAQFLSAGTLVTDLSPGGTSYIVQQGCSVSWVLLSPTVLLPERGIKRRQFLWNQLPKHVKKRDFGRLQS